jgi:hypothetical protein
MSFDDPGSSSGDPLPLDELNGSLLLFKVHEETGEINTVHGPSTAIRADVAVLDGELKGNTYDDRLLFPKILKNQLRKSIGGMVLGRLGQGEKQPGKNPPWTLTAATEAEKQTGHKYLAHVAAQIAPAVEEEPF